MSHSAGCLALSAALIVGASCGVRAQDSPDDMSEMRLATMKAAAKEYVFRGGSNRDEAYQVIVDPLLRFTNPVSGLQAGGFFVWTNADGRPMAGAQIFLTADHLWLHEFQSLSPKPFTVLREHEAVWEPKKAGVGIRPVPNAPVPAENEVKRLVQMREIAKRFTATDEFEGRKQSDALRLLSKPLVRFGKEGGDTLDGALFTLAHGTDPELLILIEAQRDGEDFRWHYSLAPMTGYALQASLDGQPVWDVGWRKPPYSPLEPFFLRVHSREPISGK